VKNNAYKLSGRTPGTYTGDKSEAFSMTLCGPLHMGFPLFGDVLGERYFL
jgi:hypothetical protein